MNARLVKREAGWVAAIKKYFAEMALIRNRMKATDRRIRRADQTIRRSQDEIRAILHHARRSPLKEPDVRNVSPRPKRILTVQLRSLASRLVNTTHL